MLKSIHELLSLIQEKTKAEFVEFSLDMQRK